MPSKPRRGPTGDYAVGYCKPPTHTQFKPSQSGHPAGRPKGAKGLKTILNEELRKVVAVTINGKLEEVTQEELFIRMLVARSIKGDGRAVDQVIKLINRTGGLDIDETDDNQLSPDDEAILEAFRAKILAERDEPDND